MLPPMEAMQQLGLPAQRLMVNHKCRSLVADSKSLSSQAEWPASERSARFESVQPL